MAFRVSSLLSGEPSVQALSRSCCCCSRPLQASPCFLPFVSRRNINCNGNRTVGRNGNGNWSSLRLVRKNSVQSLIAEPEPEHEQKADEFAKRLEQSWDIRKQPVPKACETCCAQGSTECPWCQGTGFFILGDNMLCEVPSRNTTCRICNGNGTIQCSDCKGTGFRARWMGQPPSTETHGGEQLKR